MDLEKLENKQRQEAEKIGENIIRNNQYAVVTMAGGQGTRLGWKGPKGTYKLDIGENGKYIFEILAESMKKSKDLYNVFTYWYIMTSKQNDNETKAFFDEHNYFGYDKEKVVFFTQGELPVLTESGKIVLVNIGNFYVASGKDAVLLNKILDLKLTCLEKEICKVGFPISALEKYTNKIQEKQYSYIVYRYIAKEVKLEITKIRKAKNKNEITQEKANCLLCKGIKSYPKEDKYIEAVAKLYEKEDEINRAKEQRKKRKIWFQKKNKQIN